MESCILNHLSPFLEATHTSYELQCASQQSLLLICQTLETMYLSNEGPWLEEFKLLVAKQRDKLL